MIAELSRARGKSVQRSTSLQKRGIREEEGKERNKGWERRMEDMSDEILPAVAIWTKRSASFVNFEHTRCLTQLGIYRVQRCCTTLAIVR